MFLSGNTVMTMLCIWNLNALLNLLNRIHLILIRDVWHLIYGHTVEKKTMQVTTTLIHICSHNCIFKVPT